jgi:E3 ubiquitin-protein ligase RFWD2
VDLPAKEVDSLLQLLCLRKQQLEQEEAESNMDILIDFLRRSQLQKQEELREVSALVLFAFSYHCF